MTQKINFSRNSSPDSIRLGLLGDINLGGILSSYWYNTQFDPFRKIYGLFTKDDILYGNIENVFYRGPLRPKRSSHLWAPPESARSLKNLGINVAGFANNHALDFGINALLHSMQLLKEYGIACIGAGRTIMEASTGCIIIKKGWKVGFLAYTTNAYYVRSILVSSFSVGCASMDKKRMKADIDRLRSQVDVLCIALHWGYEYLHIPHPKQRELAKVLISLGADVIIGTHPHVIQGYEFIRERPIIYSLGNFIFPSFEKIDGTYHKWDYISNKSIAVIVQITKKFGKLDFKISNIPLVFNFPRVEFMVAKEREDFELFLDLCNKALQGDRAADDFFKETMVEFRMRDRQWRQGLFYRIFRQIFLEPLMFFVGPYRTAAIKMKLKRINQNIEQ